MDKVKVLLSNIASLAVLFFIYLLVAYSIAYFVTHIQHNNKDPHQEGLKNVKYHLNFWCRCIGEQVDASINSGRKGG